MRTDLLETLYALFAGNPTTYAVGRPHRDPDKAAKGKLEYYPVHEPMTPEVWRDHMLGVRRVGVYPIDPATNLVHWFAMDFDGPPDDPQAFQTAHADAGQQQLAFLSAGLLTHLERSQSGQGVHVWGFLETPLPADVVRRAVLPHLEQAATADRVYPLQDALLPGKLGNLLALPYYGWETGADNAVFLEGGGVLSPEQFVARVRRNAATAVQLLADKASKRPRAAHPGVPGAALVGASAPGGGDATFDGRPKRPIRGVLKLVSKYGCDFMRYVYHHRADPTKVSEEMWYAALGQLTCFQHGRDAAHLFSEGHPGYSPAETDAKFDHAFEHPPVGCARIHERFPQAACAGCPLTAPYHQAERPILQLVGEADTPMQRVTATDTLDWVRQLHAGAVDAGTLWGIDGFDQWTTLRPSELVVVGAPPSVGKTALMINAMVAIARQGVPVLAFSAETGERSLEVRLLAHLSGVDSKAIRAERKTVAGDPWPLSADEWRDLEAARERLAVLPLYTQYTSVSADGVLHGIEDILLRERLPFDRPYVVFFDYLQFGAKMPDDDSDFDRLERLIRQFKGVAQIINQPVVVFSQLKRREWTSKDGEALAPSISDFKGTGRIEADADVAMIIWGERQSGAVVPRKVTIVKQREGEANVTMELLLDQTTCLYFQPGRPGAPPPPAGPDVFGEAADLPLLQ